MDDFRLTGGRGSFFGARCRAGCTYAIQPIFPNPLPYGTFDIPPTKAQTPLPIYEPSEGIIMTKMPSIRKIRTINHKPIRKPSAPKARTREAQIEGQEYDLNTQMLMVTFRGGRKYRYAGVDTKTAEGLANASSKGSFMRASVVGKFATTKL